MRPDDYRVPEGINVDLTGWNPDDTADVPDKSTGKELLKANRKEIRRLQERLFAENRQSLLVVMQATDTGGKDGCIKNVFKGVNQSGTRVWSFGVPSETELSHDFLWRIHQRTPATGHISVFNRSHYEDVLVARVKDLVPKSVWNKRYNQINMFEQTLAEHGTRILKFYLHISKDEQKERLESRLEDPEKHWKFSKADLAEREYWDDYQNAYEVMLSKTSTGIAPWYVVPANKKWFRNVVVSGAIRNALEEMDPHFPPPEDGLDEIIVPD